MDGYKRMLWTLLLVFAGGFVVQWMKGGMDIFATSTDVLKVCVNAGVVAVGGVVANWLAPWIHQYGVGSEQ